MASLRMILFTVLTAVFLVTLVGFLGGIHWFPDLFAHFRMQYAALALLLLLATFAFKESRRVWVILCFIMFALNFAPLWPYLLDKPVTGEGDTPPIRLLAWNTWRESVKWDEIEAFVRAGEFDIVLLQETSLSVREQAGKLSDLFETWVSDEFVIMVTPDLLPDVTTEDEDGDGEVNVVGVAGGVQFQITAGPHQVAILVAHLSMPISGASARKRAEQIAEIARWSNQQESVHLVVGDLNMTPWSAGFQDLVARTKLRDTMVGFGLQSTWPFQNSLASLFQIPIDHCLVSPGLFASQRRAGPPGSSNHRPLLISLVPERAGVR